MNKILGQEVSLFIAIESKELVKCGQPSFFLWGDHVALFEEPTWFLYTEYVRRGATPSIHTWSAVAHDLKTWFQYLQAKGMHWQDASESTRREFGNDYSSAVSPNGGTYEDATINRRLTNVRLFYRFCVSMGRYFGDIGSSVETVQLHDRPIDEDALAHTRTNGERILEKDSLLRKVGRKDVIKPLQVSQLKKLLRHAGPNASDRKGDMHRVRDRLIIDCGWICGMRLGDVVKLTTLKFLSIIVEPGQELVDFPLIIEKGKGNVNRMVSVPGWLVKDIQEYVSTERAESVRAGAQRYRKSVELFLGHSDSKSAGRPITTSAIQKMFALNCIQCGIVEHVEWVNPETREKHVKTVAAHSFHDLRHNCAVLTYHAEKASGNAEPWKVVQIKLGHKSLKVTVDTYLAHVSIFGEKQGVLDMRRLVGLK